MTAVTSFQTVTCGSCVRVTNASRTTQYAFCAGIGTSMLVSKPPWHMCLHVGIGTLQGFVKSLMPCVCDPAYTKSTERTNDLVCAPNVLRQTAAFTC